MGDAEWAGLSYTVLLLQENLPEARRRALLGAAPHLSAHEQKCLAHSEAE